jgi:hypothetical protein
MRIPEVEVSLTATCSLSCAHCGFSVPQQPKPAITDAAEELRSALGVLERAGVHIGSLALLGGEATLAWRVLQRAAKVAAAAPNVDSIELVTNGLTPGGLHVDCLPHLDQISLSDYTSDSRLYESWARWLGSVAPHIKLIRRQHNVWDRWDDVVDLGEEGGQAAYERCWYRQHCVTLERGRIFLCSRIPKQEADEQGLLLTEQTSAADIDAYLRAPKAPGSCRTCTPMAGLPGVAPGQQPDERLERLLPAALRWFDTHGKNSNTGRGDRR